MPDSDARRAEPAVVVGILGRVRARSGGQELHLGGPRQRALLAALAVAVGRTVPTDTLIDAVWDGDPPDAADKTFRSYVSRLRKVLGRAGVDGAEVVRTDAAGYRLDGHLTATDAQLFEAEVDEARQQLAAGQAAAAASGLAAALNRWEGQALGEFADRVWAAPTSVRLEEQRLAAEELLVRALLDADRTADAVTGIEQLAAEEPLRESVARLHALALHRAGRDADAMRTARQFRERLVDEHGLDPSPQLAVLESMILDRDPRLDRSIGGRRLRGYVLHEPIGRSPLGTVHRAEQPSIDREVAVTVLPPERADDPGLVQAFETRVQAVAGLEHPHVLPVYDYWREPGGAYVVTRFPSGGTLEQRLRTGALEVDEALRIGEQVAGALAAAHEVGIVHGEVGPDAIVVDERGDAFVWAFSLAGDVHASDDVAGLAALVISAVGGAPSGGGVATARLPSPVARIVERAATPTGDDVVTAAALANAFAAGRVGDDVLPVVPVPTGPNPYRGLAAFRETDADVFFGRDELVEQLLARIARTRAVAVVGPSGSGKSSVVRAGVLPQLRTEGAFVTTMVPGTRPLAELEIALSRVAAVELPGIADEVAATPAGLGRVVRRLLPGAGGELVLVVDQFEELFTLSEPTERDLLLQALVGVVDDPDAPVRVVATVRADFLGQVLSHATAGPLVRDRAVMVTPLTDDELHQVVVGPAEVAGVAVEPALATAIVADAARAPGSLPMVQFALTEVFEAAEDGTMTLAAYRRIGGIEGVLGQRAEEVFDGLGDADQQAAHQLLQRLVVPNADGPPTRRRAPRTEFAHVPEEVIESFGRARLLRFDHDQQTRDPTVEVTHEALFRAWPRLRAWIEEGEDDLRLLGHLTVSAQEWDHGGRREADLYRGHRLDSALTFARDRRNELSPIERAFLDASTAQRVRDAEADRRSVRRLRVLTSGLAVGLVLALVAGVLAMVARDEEAAARQDLSELADDLQAALSAEATTSATARARELAGLSTISLDEDPERSLLLALEAVRVARNGGTAALPEARSALQVATSRHRVLVRVPDVGMRTSVSPDGTRIATSGSEEDALDEEYGPDGVPTQVAIWSPAGERLSSFVVPGPVADIAWVDDESLAVMWANDDGTATPAAVYRATGELVTELSQPPGAGNRYWLHAAAGVVVATGNVGPLAPSVAWDARSGAVLHVTEPGWSLSIVDGDRLAVWDGSDAWTLDLASGATSPRFATPPASDIGPARGDLLPLFDFRGSTMAVVDLATGEVVADAGLPVPTGHAAWVDDHRLATSDNTGDLRVLDTVTGAVERWRPMPVGVTWDVGASSDGSVLVVTSGTGIGDLAVVDTTAGDGAFELGTPPLDLHGAPTEDHLLADVHDGVRSLHTERGTTAVLLDGVTVPQASGQRTTSSADGSTVGWIDTDLTGWIERNGELLELPRCHNPRAFSDDGRLVLVDTALNFGCPEGEDRGYVLDLATGRRTVLPTAADPANPVLDGAFGPPDTAAAGLVIVNRGFFHAEVVDLETASVLASFTPVKLLYGAAVSPDGATALWGSDSGRLTVLDLAALRSEGELDEEAHVRYLESGGQTGLSITVNGDLVAAGTGNNQVMVFDHTTGERIARFDVDAVRRPVVELHRGSMYYSDGTVVRRMPLDIDELVAIGESRLTRAWRPEECEEYGIPDC